MIGQRRAGRPMAPGAILQQVVVEDAVLAPDGSFAVVVRRSVAGDAYRSHLWLVRLGSPRSARLSKERGEQSLTSGDVRDTVPRISPDGSRVAFIRSWPGDPARRSSAMVLKLAGLPEEPVAIVAPSYGISDLLWSPDGDRLAFIAPADPPRFYAEPLDPERAPVARRIARIDWRRDGVGFLDRWEHLWVVAARPGARPMQLTSGDWSVQHPAWSPDGREIAYAADTSTESDIASAASIYGVPARGGAARTIVRLAGGARRPAWSPDGRLVACLGIDVTAPTNEVPQGVFVAPAHGTGAAISLGPELDRPVGAWQDTDLNGWINSSRPGPLWDGPSRVIALVTDRGQSVPFAFSLNKTTGLPVGEPTPMTTIDGRPDVVEAAAWTIDVAGGVVAVVSTLGDAPMDLHTVEPSGRLRRRSTLGSAWRRGYMVPEMQRLAAPGAGGLIDCWIASPPNSGNRPLPTIVNFHGGPLGAWAPAPALEVHMLVGRGYRVLLPNVRGSTSYGAAWIRPQLGDWGGVDASDAHAAVDHVVALGLSDPDRMGILGLSYGGFLVNWLAATSKRFRAAVTDGGVANQVSSWANSDAGPAYCRAAGLDRPFSSEGVERLWRQSPLAHVSDLRTPLLILQAEQDHTCPPADAEQLFVALRTLGRTVEYVLYPDEAHTFHITGRPDRRVDRMQRMLDWFDRHLVAESTDSLG
jgi:dipeptidyl aminopeptidase/acylaminoacyl peptidase